MFLSRSRVRLKEYAVALSLSLVERKTVKKRRGFIVRSSIGLLRFLLPRKRRLKEKR